MDLHELLRLLDGAIGDLREMSIEQDQRGGPQPMESETCERIALAVFGVGLEKLPDTGSPYAIDRLIGALCQLGGGEVARLRAEVERLKAIERNKWANASSVFGLKPPSER